MFSSSKKLTIMIWQHCNLGFSQKAIAQTTKAQGHFKRKKKKEKQQNGLKECSNTTLLSSFCEFCHAGHRGSVDPAAKGCTDDLKSSKSNRGVRRPTSQESSITNQRRMLRISFGCWKRLCAQRLRGLRRMSFFVVVLDILVRTL